VLTLALYWNGSTWAIQDTPSPVLNSRDLSLSGVSCALPSSCTTVGYYRTSGAEFTLAEAK
jgi:hypothetical protein